MTRIASSSILRPIWLTGPRALRLTTAIEQTSSHTRQAQRAATTYSHPPKPKPSPPRTPISRTPYKRSATTTTSPPTPSPSSSSSSSSSSTPASSSPRSATAKQPAPTSAYAASQIDPLPPTSYQPPPGAPPLPDAPSSLSGSGSGSGAGIDWSSSFHGLSTIPFAPDVAAVLMKAIPFEDVEIKPDGIIYLPEIKYRRILNQAFGPGGWGMAPRGDLAVGERVVTREYALLVHGRFIAQARGECQFFGNDDGIATAGEGCKSNALMRCCKDLGIASELWDPRYIRDFKKKYSSEIWVEHVATKKKRLIWVRKGDDPSYPYKKS